MNTHVQHAENTTYLARSAKEVEVLIFSNRLAWYSPLRVSRSCAIVCARVSNCPLLACACSTDNQIYLSTEKAGARYGTGTRDKHWCMKSIVEKGPQHEHNLKPQKSFCLFGPFSDPSGAITYYICILPRPSKGNDENLPWTHIDLR